MEDASQDASHSEAEAAPSRRRPSVGPQSSSWTRQSQTVLQRWFGDDKASKAGWWGKRDKSGNYRIYSPSGQVFTTTRAAKEAYDAAKARAAQSRTASTGEGASRARAPVQSVTPVGPRVPPPASNDGDAAAAPPRHGGASSPALESDSSTVSVAPERPQAPAAAAALPRPTVGPIVMFGDSNGCKLTNGELTTLDDVVAAPLTVINGCVKGGGYASKASADLKSHIEPGAAPKSDPPPTLARALAHARAETPPSAVVYTGWRHQVRTYLGSAQSGAHGAAELGAFAAESEACALSLVGDLRRQMKDRKTAAVPILLVGLYNPSDRSGVVCALNKVLKSVASGTPNVHYVPLELCLEVAHVNPSDSLLLTPDGYAKALSLLKHELHGALDRAAAANALAATAAAARPKSAVAPPTPVTPSPLAQRRKAIEDSIQRMQRELNQEPATDDAAYKELHKERAAKAAELGALDSRLAEADRKRARRSSLEDEMRAARTKVQKLREAEDVLNEPLVPSRSA